jgi:hypothetical protein
MRAGRKALRLVAFAGNFTRYQGSVHKMCMEQEGDFFANLGGTAGVNALVPDFFQGQGLFLFYYLKLRSWCLCRMAGGDGAVCIENYTTKNQTT